MADGLHIYDDPVGILTNNPPFPQQMAILNRYRGLSPRQPQNTFAPGVELPCYSRGMGAKGLPGDLSSDSRFVRAAFTRMNSVSGEDETESVSQFFHILGSVEQVRGCCEVAPASMRSLFIPPAAMPPAASTTTPPTATRRLPP